MPQEENTFPIAKPRRYRNKDHLRYVARQACLICGRQPSDPHHLRYAQPRALGRKSSDEFTVPLCRVHHREVHRVSNEQAWWQSVGIDPLSVAQQLWETTRLNEGRLVASPQAGQPSGPSAQTPTDPRQERQGREEHKLQSHSMEAAGRRHDRAAGTVMDLSAPLPACPSTSAPWLANRNGRERP